MGVAISYNPAIHHRRSIRLAGYDYSKAGLYFVTMVVQHRKCLFGTIGAEPVGADLRVCPSPAGTTISRWYLELPRKFPDIVCREYVVMPNHFHCILENTGAQKQTDDGKRVVLGEHKGSPLHAVVQWFKTMTTNEYIRGVKNMGWQRFDGKLWQRNYWEHIIRNDYEYERIAQYIIDNPSKWHRDSLNIANNANAAANESCPSQ